MMIHLKLLFIIVIKESKSIFPVLCFLFLLSVISFGQDTIRLKCGDTIHGNIIRQTDTRVVLDHPSLGELVIDKATIDTVNPGVIEPTPVEKVVPEEKPGRLQRLKDDGWSMSFDFSLDGSYGNTEEQAMRLGYVARREIEDQKLKFDTSYFNKLKDSRVSDNKLSIGLWNEWQRSQDYFNFILGRYDFDEFKSWRQRANIHAGPGYYIIETDSMEWKVQAGLGVRKEWKSFNDSVKFEGLLGTGFRWGINPRQNFEASFLYFPVLSNTDDYRWWLDFNWRFALDQDATIEWLIGGLYEYQSIVTEGDKKLDIRLYTGIQFAF